MIRFFASAVTSMAELFVTKTKTKTGYGLLPAHDSDLDEIKKLPKGQPLRVKITRVRNVQFHRKLFALLNYLFDIWEPDADAIGEKNFDRFRGDIIILAGFYVQHIRIDGSVRVEPQSISFANMDQDEFDRLYEKVIDVGVKYVARNYTGDELRRVMDQIEAFD